MPGPALGEMAPSAAGDDGRAWTLDEVLAGQIRSCRREKSVAATGHVGGDGDHAETAGLGDDLAFLLWELGVEDDVANALALEDSESSSDFSIEVVPTRTGCLTSCRRVISSANGEVLFFRGAEDYVGILDAEHLAVGRDDDDFELVDLSNSAASVSAVPVMPESFLYMRK